MYMPKLIKEFNAFLFFAKKRMEFQIIWFSLRLYKSDFDFLRRNLEQLSHVKL